MTTTTPVVPHASLPSARFPFVIPRLVRGISNMRNQRSRNKSGMTTTSRHDNNKSGMTTTTSVIPGFSICHPPACPFVIRRLSLCHPPACPGDLDDIISVGSIPRDESHQLTFIFSCVYQTNFKCVSDLRLCFSIRSCEVEAAA